MASGKIQHLLIKEDITVENKLEIIHTARLFNHVFKVYGTFEEPLFLAKDVAEWIEYDTSSIHKMLASVDEDEKVRKIVPTPGGPQEMWFLTENGLYEVLMLSRKPVAKLFKREVKRILERTVTDASGNVRIIRTPKVTGKGQRYFLNLFRERYV